MYIVGVRCSRGWLVSGVRVQRYRSTIFITADAFPFEVIILVPSFADKICAHSSNSVILSSHSSVFFYHIYMEGY